MGSFFSFRGFSSPSLSLQGVNRARMQEAGITSQLAATIGIAVDHRRRNKSTRTFKTNVQRLKLYKSKLVIFPKKKGGKKAQPKKLDTPAAQRGNVTQVKGAPLPLTRAPLKTRHRAITADEKLANRSVYAALRRARADARLVGLRKKRAAEKAAEPKKGDE